MYDLIIIGGGIAGYSAAMYAKRFEMNVLLISQMDGGTITQTHLVENYPGFASISGFDLGMKIVDHAKSIGTETIYGNVVDINKQENIFSVFLDNKQVYQSKTVLLATGTHHREIGLDSERRLKNKGVSYCATCDGAFFKDKIVAVVGGSDSAVKEALLLSQYCQKVYIIYRKSEVRAEPINKKRMLAQSKIEVITNANVIEVLGENKVSGVKLDNGQTVDLQGLFIEIGRLPQSELAVKLGVKLNDKQEVIINQNTETNIAGFFAAGDVTNSDFKQAIVSASDGSKAANQAFNFLGNYI